MSKSHCRKVQRKNKLLSPSSKSRARLVLLGFFFTLIVPFTSGAAIDRAATERISLDETARLIRAELMSDESLSSSAKNIQITVNDDVLTLRGPVTSEAEKIEVARTANRIAPALRIENELYVFR